MLPDRLGKSGFADPRRATSALVLFKEYILERRSVNARVLSIRVLRAFFWGGPVLAIVFAERVTQDTMARRPGKE
jgi:hypothetical protein